MDRVRRALRALIVVPVVYAVTLPLSAAPIPLASFSSEPQMRTPDLSPDGTKLIFISAVDNKPIIGVQDLVTGNVQGLMGGVVRDFRVSSCWFKNNERVLCNFKGVDHINGDPIPISRLVAVNIDGSKERVLVQNGASNASSSQYQDRIVHTLPNDPKHVLIELSSDTEIFPSVYKLDVYSGSLNIVQRSRAPIMSWVADRAGVVRFGFGYREHIGQYIARDADGAPWRTLEKFKLLESSFNPMGFGVRPNTLLVTAPHNGRDAVWEMDLEDKSEMQLVYSQSEVDVDEPLTWPDGRIAGFSYESDRPHYFFIDPEYESVQKLLDNALPGRVNRIIDGSLDTKKLLILSYSDVVAPSYWLLDLTQRRLRAVGFQQPALKDVKLAPMKPITVPGPDGIKIPGYLTIPVGKDPKLLPTVVYPHGGPHARDSWGYDPVVQVLASRGYAVLQLNFRGSTGYGTEWYEAGFRHWGTVMHDDITAGAKWMVSEGIADPARMCIVGWSYGGYAALIGAVKEPTLYKCAVSIAGVSDIYQLQIDDSRFYGGRAMVQDITGDNRRELDAVSPRKNADRIKVPVLLIHGDDDIQVLVDHSRTMAKALKKAGVPSQLVIIEKGNHSLSTAPWRDTLYTKLESFLAGQIGQGL